jgi:predicted DNA-binding protein with PD1-like motif
MKVVPLRLHPGEDLRRALEAWMGEQQQQAGCMISAVGSLSVAQLRLAGASETTTICGELEIISLSGTLSPDGAHLHIAIADSSGAVIGGHLGPGSLVRTTAELVIGLLPEWRFQRELDPATGYAELRTPLRFGPILEEFSFCALVASSLACFGAAQQRLECN